MPTSGFFAVLRDTAKLAATVADDLSYQATKLGAAADDISSMAGHATVKTAGVAGDDLAVGAGQVGGVAANREIPAVLAIARGSAINKLWLSAMLLLVNYYLPAAIQVALCLGAIYLALEGGEGLLEHFFNIGDDDETAAPRTEAQKVKSAIRTDVVLSLEILVIALASTGNAPFAYKAAVLFMVGVVMTVGVYGLIALIIRLDDMGMSLVKSKSSTWRKLGKRLLTAAPVVLKVLEPVGMFAMFAVAGGIFTHLLHEAQWLHIEYPHWTLGFMGDTVFGIIAGTLLAGFVHQINKLRGAH
jgi:uncharacterized protein